MQKGPRNIGVDSTSGSAGLIDPRLMSKNTVVAIYLTLPKHVILDGQ